MTSFQPLVSSVATPALPCSCGGPRGSARSCAALLAHYPLYLLCHIRRQGEGNRLGIPGFTGHRLSFRLSMLDVVLLLCMGHPGLPCQGVDAITLTVSGDIWPARKEASRPIARRRRVPTPISLRRRGGVQGFVPVVQRRRADALGAPVGKGLLAERIGAGRYGTVRA